MTSRLAFKDQGFAVMAVILLILFFSITTTATYLLIQPNSSLNSSRSTMQKMIVLEAAIAKYAVDHNGTKPGSLDDLVIATGPACAADTNPVSPTYQKLQGWCGPYVDIPINQNSTDFKTDGWGKLFILGVGTLKSCGPDKNCGSADDITDSI